PVCCSLGRVRLQRRPCLERQPVLRYQALGASYVLLQTISPSSRSDLTCRQARSVRSSSAQTSLVRFRTTEFLGCCASSKSKALCLRRAGSTRSRTGAHRIPCPSCSFWLLRECCSHHLASLSWTGLRLPWAPSSSKRSCECFPNVRSPASATARLGMQLISMA